MKIIQSCMATVGILTETKGSETVSDNQHFG